VKKYEKMNS